jgi:hypothetical protein
LEYFKLSKKEGSAMKKSLFVLLVTTMVILSASVSRAEGKEFQLVGRELSPGIQSGDVYYGALFMGKILNAEYTQEVGDFSVTLNRLDEGVEQCNEDTHMLQFRLVMSFDDGNRLVLVLDDQDVAAHWGYDDPNCADGCIFPGYAYYIDQILNNSFSLCDDYEAGDPNVGLIANLGSVDDPVKLRKQWLGSSMKGFPRYVTHADLYGWLVHTPLLVPAVFGTVVAY